MTPLTKPVTRRVDFGRGKIAVTLTPDNLITFRYHKGRKVFAISIGEAFVKAVAKSVPARKRRSR